MDFLPIIQSTQNEWVKSIRKLHNRSERVQQKRFLIEGIHAVEEAVANSWPLAAIIFESKWGQSHGSVLAALRAKWNVSKTLLQPVSSEVIQKLSTTDSPCSVLGVAELDDFRLRTQNPPRQAYDASFVIAVEALQDPGNLGTLIRVSAASGFGPIHLSDDSVDPTNPKVLRSTAGQWFRNPPLTTDSLKTWIRNRKSAGYQILAACAEGKSMWNCDLSINTILLLGNEGAGLSPDLRAEATGTIAVPMSAGVESLNVAVSGALIAYEALRQRSR